MDGDLSYELDEIIGVWMLVERMFRGLSFGVF